MSDTFESQDHSQFPLKSDYQFKLYTMSLTKLRLMMFFTLGLYALVWFYSHWRKIKTNQSEWNHIWPVPRAIFSIFFTYSLFREIDNHLELGEKPYKWSFETNAWIFIITSIIFNVAGYFEGEGVDPIFTILLIVLPLAVFIITMSKAQEAANVAAEDPTGAANAGFTLFNYIFIFLGTIFWLGMLITVPTLLLDSTPPI
ncbi:MAG: hypothetical protein AAF197_00415 [Pseudomonadota bacterium]